MAHDVSAQDIFCADDSSAAGIHFLLPESDGFRIAGQCAYGSGGRGPFVHVTSGDTVAQREPDAEHQ